MASPPYILATIDAPWTDIQPILVGPSGIAARTPDRYVVLQRGQQGHDMREDLYFNPDEYNFKVGAIAWGSYLIVGTGESLYLVNQENATVVRLPLYGYFCEFFASDLELLVASSEQLLALDLAGQLIWRSEPLGIDGIVIHEVADEVIKGSGEWDPPGGWRAFVLSRKSGRLVE